MELHLAFGVLAVLYIFGIMPLIGSALNSGTFSDYGTDFMTGLKLTLVMLIVGGSIYTVLWAFSVVFNYFIPS